jgi:predicted peroxiredoxin
MPKLLINLTSAKDNPDRATVAFVVANAGLAAGQEVAIFVSVEAVRLANPGYADDIAVAGFKPLAELMAAFAANGGKIWVCPPCFNARGLNKESLVPGASFGGGAVVVEFLGQGAASLSY